MAEALPALEQGLKSKTVLACLWAGPVSPVGGACVPLWAEPVSCGRSLALWAGLQAIQADQTVESSVPGWGLTWALTTPLPTLVP